jgi:two-component system OmpR family response regulator
MRILLVEDHPKLQQSVARALRGALFAVDLASDGEEGLHKAQENEYDAILLDVMLPGLDGWTILERLRETRKTPVIMLTARDSVDDRVRGLDLGADDYLPKPFQVSELLARLRAVIRRSAGQTTTSLTLGDFVLDLKSKKISRGDENIPVTAREYGLIEYLALHRSTVVSRTELYDHLFDEEDSTLSNLLDVNVSRVRSKLGKDFIITHRGHGYSID